MKIRLGTLRKLIEANLDQMKLGIANPWGFDSSSGMADEEFGDQPVERQYLGVPAPTSFGPDDAARSRNRARREHPVDMSGEPIVDDTLPFVADDEDETQPDLAGVSSKRYAG